MSENPLISIIIAVYNNERYIRNAIKSVQNQDFSDYEIVIVDDGSTDNTPQIVDEEARKDSKIKVIHQENQWIYASFNNGIKAAKGEYIYILNSDDVLANGALKTLADCISKYNHPQVVWTKVCIYRLDEKGEKNKFLDCNPSVLEDRYVDIQTCKEDIIELLKTNIINNQANLYQRSLFEKIKFRNDVYGADYLFNLALLDILNNYVYLKDEIYQFIEYQCDSMNASIGRCYGYEHKMFNEFYTEAKGMLERKGLCTEVAMNVIRERRRKEVREEITKILLYEKSRNIDEKIFYLSNNIWDEVLEECYTINGIDGYKDVLNQLISKYMNQKDYS